MGELNEDLIALRDMVDRLVADSHSFEDRRAAISSGAGWNKLFWSRLADLGVLSAHLPVSAGGIGGGALGAAIVAQSLGKGLASTPYVPAIICAGGLLARVGSKEQRARYLAPLLAGEKMIAFACSEHGDGGELTRIETKAVRERGGYRLSGHKALVFGASDCDQMMVIARVAGQGLGAFVLPREAEGLSRKDFQTICGMPASELTFDTIWVDESALIGGERDINADIAFVRDQAIVALCGSATGSIEALLSRTVDYAKTRKQFGRPIGEFQVLQHRMVDMLVAREQAIAITYHAASALDDQSPTRDMTVSAAKAFVGRVGRKVAQAAVQIHGGIGTTDELDVSHHFREIELFNLQYGTIDDHVERYGEMLDDAPLDDSARAIFARDAPKTQKWAAQ